MLIDVRLEGEPIFLRENSRQPLWFERAHLNECVGELLPGFLSLPGFFEVMLGNP